MENSKQIYSDEVLARVLFKTGLIPYQSRNDRLVRSWFSSSGNRKLSKSSE